jgi:hypothetical protein
MKNGYLEELPETCILYFFNTGSYIMIGLQWRRVPM